MDDGCLDGKFVVKRFSVILVGGWNIGVLEDWNNGMVEWWMESGVME